MSDDQNIPPFLLKGAKPARVEAPAPATAQPTGEEIGAALLAYDMALPAGCSRAPLADHYEAMRAAIVAVLNLRG